MSPVPTMVISTAAPLRLDSSLTSQPPTRLVAPRHTFILTQATPRGRGEAGASPRVAFFRPHRSAHRPLPLGGLTHGARGAETVRALWSREGIGDRPPRRRRQALSLGRLGGLAGMVACDRSMQGPWPGRTSWRRWGSCTWHRRGRSALGSPAPSRSCHERRPGRDSRQAARTGLSNAEVPEPAPGQVVVKIRYCGVCATECTRSPHRDAAAGGLRARVDGHRGTPHRHEPCLNP